MFLKKFLFNRKKKKIKDLEYESTNGCPFVEELFCSNFFSIFHNMYDNISITDYREKYGYNPMVFETGLLIYKIHNTIITIDEELSNSLLKIKTTPEKDTLIYGTYNDFYRYFNTNTANISQDMHAVKKLFDLIDMTHYSNNINIEFSPEKIHIIDRYNDSGIQYLCIMSSNDNLINLLNVNYIRPGMFIVNRNDTVYRFLRFEGNIEELYNVIKDKTSPELLELKNIVNSLFFINDDEDNIESNNLYYTNIDEILD